jgi:MFS family permease
MKLRRSLQTSIIEGALAEAIAACATGGVTTAWALYLGLSNPVIGLLGALPVTALLVQPATRRLSRRLGNRTFALWATALARQCVLPLVFLPLVPLSRGARQAVFVACAVASTALGVAGNNAWSAWMGDLVPGTLRARYFGRRAAACALASALSSLAAGLALDGGARRGQDGPALAALSLLASLAGALTTVLLRRQHLPRAKVAAPARAEDADAPAGARKLLAFTTAWSFAVGVAAAFYPLHMVSSLRMSFAGVALYGAAVALFRMVSAPLVGRALARTGARAVLVGSALALALSPALWLVAAPGRLWPLALDAALSGAAGAGLAQATFHLPIALARPGQRSSLAGALAAAGGLATGVSAAAGGALVRALPAAWSMFGRSLAPFQGVFLIGAVARLFAALLGLRIEEPRPEGA